MTAEPTFDEDAAPLEAPARTAALVAGLLGLFGLGYALFSLVMQGAAALFLFGTNALGPMAAGSDLVAIHMALSVGVGVLSSLGALLTAWLAMAASASAILGHRRRPLRWAAAIIVGFDAVFYLVVPLSLLAFTVVLAFAGAGVGGATDVALAVFTTAVMLVWSLGLVAFWIWCFTLMKED
ncbi:MAG: hypothetical protein AB8H79_12905 [Myxococcota bacterium]